MNGNRGPGQARLEQEAVEPFIGTGDGGIGSVLVPYFWSIPLHLGKVKLRYPFDVICLGEYIADRERARRNHSQ